MACPIINGSISTGVVDAGGAASLTVSHTISTGLNNPALIVVVGGVNMSTGSVKWGGSGGTDLALLVNYGVQSEFISVWYLSNPTTGTNDVYASTPSSNRTMMHCMTWQDVASTVSDGTPGTANGNDASPSVNMTTSTDNSAVMLVVGNDPKTKTISFPAGETQKSQTTNTTNNDQCTTATLDGGKATAGSVTMTATLSASGSWDAIVVAFKYQAPPTTTIKTINDLAKASVKTINDLTIASIKTVNGLA